MSVCELVCFAKKGDKVVVLVGNVIYCVEEGTGKSEEARREKEEKKRNK